MTESNKEIIINSLDTLKSYIESKDNAISNVYMSPIPEACKNEKVKSLFLVVVSSHQQLAFSISSAS